MGTSTPGVARLQVSISCDLKAALLDPKKVLRGHANLRARAAHVVRGDAGRRPRWATSRCWVAPRSGFTGRITVLT